MIRRQEPIAIIGVGLRFPGGNDTLDDFAEFLRTGGSGIRPLPTDRWDLRPFAATDSIKGKIRTAGGGFLDDIDQFDAPFFNISPNEARYVDPQQRLLMETAWLALENASQDTAALRGGNGGVFIGASSVDYALELESLPYEQMDPALATGFTFYPMSGRLSYFLGWHGPSLNTDTACSSSLTALHLAGSALRRAECDIALVGAVNCIHHPRTLVMFSHGEMLAPDGRCKAFDESADGFARSEGCGVLVLKRASTARRDGDTVLALVRGSAIGQDGASAGLTAPNGTAQQGVLRAALADAGLTAGDIQYLEAHGTGTPIGDPIELGAINGVFAEARSVADPLVVGSVKTNLGHMEAVAGIGGIIKIIAQLRDREIYPHHYDRPSGRIPWDTYRVAVPRNGRKWSAPTRRAMVNSFGLAGAIGVAVLEQAPPVPPRQAPAADNHVFTLSARNTRALRRQIERYQRFLTEHPDVDLGDLCYTGNVGRTHFSHRIADAVADHAELAALLERQATQPDRRTPDSFRKSAFLFAGAGSQHVGMGRALYEQFPVFHRYVDECDHLFAPHLGRSVRALMFGEVEDAERIHETRYTQPALFTLEYALAMLWCSWGVRPSVLIGHSAGEIVAATVAGVFNLADGVRFTATRSRLMQSVTAAGAMAAVQAPASEVALLLAGQPALALAADNSPSQCVISGDRDALAALVDTMRADGLHVTPLAVSIAAHSPLLAEITGPLRAVLGTIRFGRPTIPLMSNLTGKLAAPAEIGTAEYWVRHLLETVNFQAGMRAVERRGRHVFVEIGPSTTLTSPAAQCVDAAAHRWLTSSHPEDGSARTIRRAVAEMYVSGLPVAWPAVHAGRERHKITLPGYVFERKRYWLPNAVGRHHPMDTAARSTHLLLGAEVSTPEQIAGGVREFTARISATHPAYLADNMINGVAFFPAAGYVEVLLAVQDAVYGEVRQAVANVQFPELLVLRPDTMVDLRTRLHTAADGTATVRILAAQPGHPQRCHAIATLAEGDPAPPVAAMTTTGTAFQDPDTVLSAEEVYAAYARAGVDYGPEFRRVRSAARHGADMAIGELVGRAAATAEFLPPPLVEAATHVLAALLGAGDNYIISRCASIRFGKKPKADTLRAELRRAQAEPDADEMCVQITVWEGDRLVVELDGLVFTRLPQGLLAVPEQTDGAGATADSALLVEIDPVKRRPAIENLVRATVARILHIDELDTIDSGVKFAQLGLNSLLAVQLTSALSTTLGVNLPRSVVLDHPSVDLLTDFLDRRRADGPVVHTA